MDLSGAVLGEFVLRDRIGEGGCGAVYRCEQPKIGREAVVKVLYRRVGDDFSREAHLAARLDHPYAAHVYAIGVEDDGLLWIAMELVHGVTLSSRLEERGSIPLEQFVPIFRRLCEVVHTAHERGIVHCDLKPANVMLVEQAGEVLPKLLDFGIARLIDDSEPEDSETVLGSPVYLAPEVWTGSVARPAADIYALGVIAYEALTGRWPFRADSTEAIGQLHLKGAVPPTRLSDGLDRVFAKALAKSADDRYDSALDLAAAFRAEVDARRAAEVQVRARRRARRLGGVLGAVAALAIGGVAVGRSRYETRIAQQAAEDARALTRATAVTAEVEQGRAALLHDDLREAQRHLGAAWRMGDRSASTEFMLARAEQPLRAELARLSGTGRMWSASWSPDGSRIATTDDHGAQIWDASTYQQLSPLPHGDTVYAAVWMDATRLATACGDGSVRIWDATRGSLVRELRLHGKVPRWYTLAVSGGRVAAVDAKGAIAAVWDIATGTTMTELPLSADGWPSIAFSADGRWLAATGGAAATILDTATWRRTTEIGEQVRAIAWDPTWPRLVTGSAGGGATLWSVPGGGWQTLQLGESVTAVAFAPDGRRLVLGGEDGSEQIVDASTGRILSQGNYLHAKISSIAFSADGQRIVAAAMSGSLAIGDAASGLPVEVIDGPTLQLRGASFGATGHRVLAASWDGTARIWNARSPYRQWSAGPIGTGYGLVGGATPDGRYLAVACPGCATRIWDTAHDRLLAELPSVDGGDPVPFPVVSSDGTQAAIARGNVAEVYELPGGRLLRRVEHAAAVTALAFSGDELVSGDSDGAVNHRENLAMGAEVDALAMMPNGLLVVADAARRVLVGVEEFAIGIRARILRPSPDGNRLLALAYYTGKAEPMVLVDLINGTVVKLESPPAVTARWTARGILSAHVDGAARLWSASGTLLRTYIGGTRLLVEADLSQDGSRVAGGGADGVLRFWDVETGRPLWVVAAHRPYVMGVHFEGDDIVTRGIGGEVARWHVPDAIRKDATPLPIP